MKTASPFRIRLLGELQLVGCDARAVPLPASRKTRALLGFLVATGQLHRRERLCDLFWDGPDDPRAELRWSLSKIRPLLAGRAAPGLLADRERVGIELGKAVVDLQSVRALLGSDVSGAPLAALKEASALFGGEFLDGLDLPLCYRYQEWCMAEREAVSRQRVAVLATLVERLRDDPAEALAYARALTAADPLSEPAHAAVIRLLGELGRTREAYGQYEHAKRILETELGVRPSAELKEAQKSLRAPEPSSAPARSLIQAEPLPSSPQLPGSVLPLVGRHAERALIERLAAMRSGPRALMLAGEPGIGKSRMLAHVGERIVAAGGQAFRARVYEAEAGRAYGVWIDVLRAIARDRPPEKLPPDLALLLPEIDASPVGSADRARLFDAVLILLRQVASERPTAVILDDVQWLDEASSSLLHYVVRGADAVPGLLVVCAARSGEIEDNAAAARTMRSLRSDGRLREVELVALSAEETADLVREVDPALDATSIFAASEGNPLFTLALAGARRGDAEPARTVEAIIAGQLASLSYQAREALLWAAAYGRAFTPDDLARAARRDSAELLMTLGELERRGLVRLVGPDGYSFTHDLVRETTYRTLAQPRRTLLHRHIARALDALIDHDVTLAADLVHHAALAGDDQLSARACALAGEQALRVFANNEAAAFAERGLRHAERLADGPATLEVRIGLLRVRVLASSGPGMRPLPPLAGTIAELTDAAEALGLQAAAATGHYLLSVLHQEAGETLLAEASTLRAAEAGRGADAATRAHQLANTARCLLELEVEIGRARGLIAEAGAVAGSLGQEMCELHWARGLLERWDGHEERAISSLVSALALSRRGEDRWREYKCLTWLAMLDYELGRYADLHKRCAELRTVAARLGEDEAPFAETLRRLALLASKEGVADGTLEEALARLRAVDDKSYLAYALNAAARLRQAEGRSGEARGLAQEALAVALVMRRRNEIAIAEAILAAAGAGDPVRERGTASLGQPDRDEFSARARSAFLASGPAIPTEASTPTRQI